MRRTGGHLDLDLDQLAGKQKTFTRHRAVEPAAALARQVTRQQDGAKTCLISSIALV